MAVISRAFSQRGLFPSQLNSAIPRSALRARRPPPTAIARPDVRRGTTVRPLKRTTVPSVWRAKEPASPVENAATLLRRLKLALARQRSKTVPSDLIATGSYDAVPLATTEMMLLPVTTLLL